MAEYLTTDNKYVKPQWVSFEGEKYLVAPPVILNEDTLTSYITKDLYKDMKKKHLPYSKKFWNVVGSKDGRYQWWNKDKELEHLEIPNDFYESIMKKFGITTNGDGGIINYLNYIK